jgi:hypothetical protein
VAASQVKSQQPPCRIAHLSLEPVPLTMRVLRWSVRVLKIKISASRTCVRDTKSRPRAAEAEGTAGGGKARADAKKQGKGAGQPD